jgi:hypothetical protein
MEDQQQPCQTLVHVVEADQGVDYSHRRWSHSHTFQSGGHTQTDGPTLLESFSVIHKKTTQFWLQFHTISWTSEEWEPSTLKSICLFTPGGGWGVGVGVFYYFLIEGEPPYKWPYRQKLSCPLPPPMFNLEAAQVNQVTLKIWHEAP